MPFQVNGQAVTTKSSRLLQVAGCSEAVVVAVGTAFVARMSAAAASVAYTAPASPKIIDAKTPPFFIPRPPQYDRFRAVPRLHISQQSYSVNYRVPRRSDQHIAAVASRSKRQERSDVGTHA